MAAPTTLLVNGAGVISATGEANGILIPINQTILNAELELGIYGTFTSCVLAIRGQIIPDGSYYPVPVLNQTNTSNPSNSASISLTNSTAVSFRVAVGAFVNIEVYVVSGTPTTFNVEGVVKTGNDGAPVTVAVNTAGAGSFTNVTASGTLAVTGASTLTGDLTESGNAAITGTLAVTGAQTFTGDTTMSGNASVGGTFGTTGLLTAATLTTTGAVNHAADVTLTGGADLNFSGTTGQCFIRFTDNLASALVIGEAANAYLTFVSTNGSEAINLGKPQRLPTPTTVAVGGTAIGNANAVTEGFTIVTGANNSAAVKLPPTVAGAVCTIKSNTSGSTLQVFPPVNSSINAGAANAVYNMANLSLRTFYAYNSTLWITDPETPT